MHRESIYNLIIYFYFRRDLSRAITLLEMVKRREKTKREHLHLSIEIYEKRYQARDFSGQILSEYSTNVTKNTRYFKKIISYIRLNNTILF